MGNIAIAMLSGEKWNCKYALTNKKMIMPNRATFSFPTLRNRMKVERILIGIIIRGKYLKKDIVEIPVTFIMVLPIRKAPGH
jgi:hypothetical protein